MGAEVARWPGGTTYGLVATIEESDIPTGLVTELGIARGSGDLVDCPVLVLPNETFVLRITAMDDLSIAPPLYVSSDITVKPTIIEPDGTKDVLDEQEGSAPVAVLKPTHKSFDYQIKLTTDNVEGSYYLDVDVHINRVTGPGDRDGSGHYHVFDVSANAPAIPGGTGTFDISSMMNMMMLMMMLSLIMPMMSGLSGEGGKGSSGTSVKTTKGPKTPTPTSAVTTPKPTAATATATPSPAAGGITINVNIPSDKINTQTTDECSEHGKIYFDSIDTVEYSMSGTQADLDRAFMQAIRRVNKW